MTPVARNCDIWAVRWAQAPHQKLRFMGLQIFLRRNLEIFHANHNRDAMQDT